MMGLTLAFTITLLLGGLFGPVPADAQDAAKVARIGYLGGDAASGKHLREAFLQGLSDLGYVEGRNLVIEYRWAEATFERFPALAAELVALNVDVIFASGGTPAALAAKQATQTIPIIFSAVSDPVASGLVAGFALGVRLHVVEARAPDDFDRAFSEITRGSAHALTVLPSPMFLHQRTRLVEMAAKSGLRAIYPFREAVDAGGLMSYAPNAADGYRRAATYVAKILKGAKPGDLPVEQPTKFELVINLKAAKALGLTIPASVLARADEVIEK